MNDMGVKEAIAWLTPFDTDVNLTPDHIRAIETLKNLAISKLSLLEKVEKGGVKKYKDNQWVVAPAFRNYECPDEGDLKIYTYGFNSAIDLCNAHLVNKLEGIEGVIENWFIALEKKQSAEQIKEVEKKGLWSADLKSATFEEIKIGLAQAIITHLTKNDTIKN